MYSNRMFEGKKYWMPLAQFSAYNMFHLPDYPPYGEKERARTQAKL